MRANDTDKVLRRLAGRHGGPFRREDALSAGIDAAAIDRRVGDGSLVRLHAGVYVLGGVTLTFADRAVGAALACGSGAVIARRSAAVIHRIIEPPAAIDIAVPRQRRVRRGGSGIAVWRTDIVPTDRAGFRRVEITSKVRTLVDLATVFEPLAFAVTVDRALTAGIVQPGSLRRVAAAQRGRPGARLVTAVVAERENGPKYRSGAERVVEEILIAEGIAAPVMQYRVEVVPGRYRFIDLAWPDHFVGIEFDADRFHRSPRELRATLVRRAELERVGWTIIPVDDEELAIGLPTTLPLLRAALRRGPARPRDPARP